MIREYWIALAISLALSVCAIAVGHRMGYCAGYAKAIGTDWQFTAGGCRLGVSGVFVPLDGFSSGGLSGLEARK